MGKSENPFALILKGHFKHSTVKNKAKLTVVSCPELSMKTTKIKTQQKGTEVLNNHLKLIVILFMILKCISSKNINSSVSWTA